MQVLRFASDAGYDWDILHQEVMELHRSGEYDRAVVVAERALELAEKKVGSDHPDTAASLTDLAALYRDTGQHALVEPLLKRALAITEKARGLDHLDVATLLVNLASCYEAAQAEPLLERALTIREKALGPKHPDVARSLELLVDLYNMTRWWTEAENLYQRVDANRGPIHDGEDDDHNAPRRRTRLCATTSPAIGVRSRET